MTLDDLAEFDVKILRLEPGDIIALRYPDLLSSAHVEELREQGRQAFGREVVVLSGGIDVVIVREPEEA